MHGTQEKFFFNIGYIRNAIYIIINKHELIWKIVNDFKNHSQIKIPYN